MEHVARTSNDLLRVQADTLAVVVHGVADLDEDLFQRGLGQGGCGGQLVAERAVDDRVVSGNEGLAVAASVARGERTVQDVGCQRLFRFDQGLSQVLGVGLTDTDVIAVFHQHFGQGEGEAIHLVHVALQEQHATALVGHGHAIRQLGSSTKAVEHRLFVVVTRNAFLLAEYHFPFVCALVVNAVEGFIQNRLND